MTKFRYVIGAALLTASAQSISDIHSQLLNCSAIENKTTRLACYDKLASAMPSGSQVSDKTALKPNQPSSQAPTNQLPAVTAQTKQAQTIQTQPSQVQASKQTIPTGDIISAQSIKKQEQDFGKPVEEIQGISQIESHIVGRFSGWKKGAIIKLANGQRWKVVSKDKGWAKLESPKVTIQSALLGTYSMKVEDFIPLAKVRRVD